MRVQQALRPLALALCGLLACRSDPPPASGGGPAVDPSTIGGRVALELWQVRPGVTLETWAASNLADQVMRADSGTHGTRNAGQQGWCARAVSSIDIAGHALKRETFFAPPPVPADLALPDSVAPELVRSCTMRLMVVSVTAPDTLVGPALADSIATQLAAAYGTTETGPTHFFGSAFWTRVARFRRDDRIAVSAYDAPAGADSSERRVVALAYLQPAGAAQGDTPVPDPARYSPADSIPLDSAVRMSGLDSSLWMPLRQAVRAGTRPAPAETDAGLAPMTAFIRPLVRWVNASAELPFPQRAAALYAADVVLERGLCAHGLCSEEAGASLAPLRAAGASFTWSPLGGTWTSSGAWLIRARILDRDSPLGQRILLAQMSRGFDFSGTCARGAEAFRTVIDNGERYLERVPESPIKADIHFLIAEAYRDVVALAAGAGSDYADASKYQEEAPQAHGLALQHYRAAIAADPRGPTGKAAWERAWWMLSGLELGDTRFFCVYD